MIISKIEIEKFRAIEKQELKIGKRLTAIVGRNASMKTTLLGMLSQPFTISKNNVMYGEKTLDGYDYRSQLKEKFKLSKEHDLAGEHIWSLFFRNSNIYNGKDYIKIKSAPRKANGKEATIRFINTDKGKAKGHGYVQIPVFFLSLTRLFPIGESGKTTVITPNLEPEEEQLFIKWYKEILSIQNIVNPNIAMERKDAKRFFAGVVDDIHDLDASSAGESNIGRIIVALLSFRKLKMKYENEYKGGILLIDEIDATLHGFSQKKMIELLSKQAEELYLQIIFTTHSPNVLKTINDIQREEVKKKGIKDCSLYEYENQIIHLQPDYDNAGRRLIVGKNITSASELRVALNDMDMKATFINQNIHLYTEDKRSAGLLERIFRCKDIIMSNYLEYIDVDLGWTNYCQLLNKEIPEFMTSMIILDKDVEKKRKNQEQKDAINRENVLLMPIDVEKGLFSYLKQYEKFNEFRNILRENQCELSYEICFSEWPETEYDTEQLKDWFKNLEKSVPNISLLYDFWCNDNIEVVNQFVEQFKMGYNKIAQEEGLDYMI